MRKQVNFGLLALSIVLVAPSLALAEGGDVSSAKGLVSIAGALAIGIAAIGGALGQGRAISSALEAIGRNPSAQGKVFIPMLLGLALIESLVILAFVIAKQILA